MLFRVVEWAVSCLLDSCFVVWKARLRHAECAAIAAARRAKRIARMENADLSVGRLCVKPSEGKLQINLNFLFFYWFINKKSSPGG